MSIKVLVADDSITIQKVIGIIFGGDEYSLTVVDNGKSAVDKAREINPDILLIDALMPGMSGYEVSELVRSTPLLASKPILILTGSFEPFDEEKAKKCGADDFIAKPFESQQIITKVKELLELGKAREHSSLDLTPSPINVFQEQSLEVSAPVFDIQPPAAIPQSSAPANIWGAFTPEIEPETPVVESVVENAPPAAFEPDVFAIVSDENDAQLLQSSVAADSSPHHTGSQWVPVEENTFEFVEETSTEPSRNNFVQPTAPFQEPSFGDIAFEDESATPIAPALDVFTTPPPIFETPAAPFTPLTDPNPPTPDPAAMPLPEPVITSTAPATLSEDQLRAALATASKEVIERIVWEVVPDLAEALIKEAIRKIKQGV